MSVTAASGCPAFASHGFPEDDIAHNLKHINDSPSVDGKSFRAWLVGQANDALKASPKADHVVVIAPDTNTHYRVVFN